MKRWDLLCSRHDWGIRRVMDHWGSQWRLLFMDCFNTIHCGNGGPRFRTGRTPKGLSWTMDFSETTSTPQNILISPEYLRTRKNIKTIAEHLQARDLLWMVSLPLVRFEPQAGLPEAVAELNRRKELRVVQRIDELQLAERWVSTQNVNQTGNKL